MLTLFTGCVSTRNMDGLVKNSKNEKNNIQNQLQVIENAANRLAQKTIFHDFGWKRIAPLVKLFTKYGADVENMELIARVLH